MVGGWLLRVVLGIALVGFIAIELGSILVARAQADDAANEIATEAAFEYGKSSNRESMQGTCKETAEKKSVAIVSCELVDGQVEVVVMKEAFSFVLDDVSFSEDWYDVRATAEAEPR